MFLRISPSAFSRINTTAQHRTTYHVYLAVPSPDPLMYARYPFDRYSLSASMLSLRSSATLAKDMAGRQSRPLGDQRNVPPVA